MCRFYAIILFPMLWDKYDYAFRLDDDVFLQESVTTDLFQMMDDKKLIYLYGSEVPEWNKVTRRTFGPWLHRHLLKTPRSITAKYNFTNTFTSSEIWSQLGSNMYFTNFFLTRLDWWKKSDVRREQKNLSVSLILQFLMHDFYFCIVWFLFNFI